MSDVVTNADALAAIRTLERWIAVQKEGGPGRGWWGPPKGTHGPGSQGGDAEAFQVGLTSYKEDEDPPISEVKEEMREFEGELKEVADDVDVQLGTGGFKGGSEPTWITEYKDGDEALSVVAKTAKKHKQNSALVMKYVGKDTPGAQPQVRLRFDDALDEPEIRVLEDAMVSEGLGGWTWMRGENGGTTLMAVSVPDWGGEANAHMDAMSNVADFADNHGLTADQAVEWVDVTLMKQGEYDQWV